MIPWNTYLTDTHKQGLLRKVSQQRVILRDSEMWRVFHCLFRACVALAYPNLWDVAPGFLWEDAPTQEEQIRFDAAGVQLPTDRNILQLDSKQTSPPHFVSHMVLGTMHGVLQPFDGAPHLFMIGLSC